MRRPDHRSLAVDDLPDVGRHAPASASRSRPSSADSGVCESGLCTTALPASSAGRPSEIAMRERVVPGRDDPDDALGDLVDVDPGEHRIDADPPLRAEVLSSGAGVVARRHRDVRDLLEGVLAGLARLPLDQVEDLVLPVEHQVVEVEQDLPAQLERDAGPGLLRAAGGVDRVGHVVGRRERQRGDRLPGERRVGRVARAGARAHPGRQAVGPGPGRRRTSLGGRAPGRRVRPGRDRGASYTERMTTCGAMATPR